jgi:hypothetical protein
MAPNPHPNGAPSKGDTMTKIKSLLLPAVAVVLGGTAAAVYAYTRNPGRSAATDVAATPTLIAEAESDSDEADANTIAGDVLERIDVGRYTYLRLGDKGSEGAWTAVPKAEVQEGAQARVVNAQKMTDFASATLKRTFPTIYFGTLDDGQGTGPRQDVGIHGNGSKPMNPHGALQGHPTSVAEIPEHHPSDSNTQSVEIGNVRKAQGPLGRQIGEVYGQRTQLAGKRVRVRGVVVKAVANVLNRTFVHLRDGSGSAEAKTHDLTAMLDNTPGVGDRILVEGTLAVDKDLGSGYQYRAILENASVVSE